MTLKHKPCNSPSHKPRKTSTKKSDSELINEFWNAPMEAFFGQETVAIVVNRKVKTIECDRWSGKGIPYRKCYGRVLYRKSDVIAWLNSFEVHTSTRL